MDQFPKFGLGSSTEILVIRSSLSAAADRGHQLRHQVRSVAAPDFHRIAASEIADFVRRQADRITTKRATTVAPREGVPIRR